ncbi:hypothetical protein cco6_00090 [Campylobacter coli 59-2]|uniref:Uncharacterized protein n=1 Tax=Campylobacter coli 80352 TaxID=887288 RepID=A0ABN0EPJ9_CAMCO|nr:hypothetical protein cco111_06389 [Campylobacter coli 2680]EIA58318.1 hypothetical protein cco117_01570 [Campylobacter coli 2698]EIA63485.1 hypothetical protein cco14_06270 [Campylobacter coli 80352]EIA82620.1 hypothetical protein cco6_00090 [Campylobacter coli 59-2]EIA97788.1 hypothetical protein cco76_01141 [Campylobacter coli LMG 23336]EIB03379.1 hypothetical protein cco8_01102 [Campylobacter coli 151-9]
MQRLVKLQMPNKKDFLKNKKFCLKKNFLNERAQG